LFDLLLFRYSVRPFCLIVIRCCYVLIWFWLFARSIGGYFHGPHVPTFVSFLTTFSFLHVAILVRFFCVVHVFDFTSTFVPIFVLRCSPNCLPPSFVHVSICCFHSFYPRSHFVPVIRLIFFHVCFVVCLLRSFVVTFSPTFPFIFYRLMIVCIPRLFFLFYRFRYYVCLRFSLFDGTFCVPTIPTIWWFTFAFHSLLRRFVLLFVPRPWCTFFVFWNVFLVRFISLSLHSVRSIRSVPTAFVTICSFIVTFVAISLLFWYHSTGTLLFIRWCCCLLLMFLFSNLVLNSVDPTALPTLPFVLHTFDQLRCVYVCVCFCTLRWLPRYPLPSFALLLRLIYVCSVVCVVCVVPTFCFSFSFLIWVGWSRSLIPTIFWRFTFVLFPILFNFLQWFAFICILLSRCFRFPFIHCCCSTLFRCFVASFRFSFVDLLLLLHPDPRYIDVVAMGIPLIHLGIPIFGEALLISFRLMISRLFDRFHSPDLISIRCLCCCPFFSFIFLAFCSHSILPLSYLLPVFFSLIPDSIDLRFDRLRRCSFFCVRCVHSPSLRSPTDVFYVCWSIPSPTLFTFYVFCLDVGSLLRCFTLRFFTLFLILFVVDLFAISFILFDLLFEFDCFTLLFFRLLLFAFLRCWIFCCCSSILHSYRLCILPVFTLRSFLPFVPGLVPTFILFVYVYVRYGTFCVFFCSLFVLSPTYVVWYLLRCSVCFVFFFCLLFPGILPHLVLRFTFWFWMRFTTFGYVPLIRSFVTVWFSFTFTLPRCWYVRSIRAVFVVLFRAFGGSHSGRFTFLHSLFWFAFFTVIPTFTYWFLPRSTFTHLTFSFITFVLHSIVCRSDFIIRSFWCVLRFLCFFYFFCSTSCFFLFVCFFCVSLLLPFTDL